MSDDPLAVAIQQIEFLRHRCDMEVAHIAELKAQVRSIALERDSARESVARLTAERDEARRELCRFYCANDTAWGSGPFPMEQSTPAMFAHLKGWDCFKEKTK